MHAHLGRRHRRVDVASLKLEGLQGESPLRQAMTPVSQMLDLEVRRASRISALTISRL